MNEFTLLYITNPSRATARKIAKHILKKRLAACANIIPNVNSIYHWRGKLADENEWQLILKTTQANVGRIEKEIEKIHPYSIPCIIHWTVRSNKKYFWWLKSELR